MYITEMYEIYVSLFYYLIYCKDILSACAPLNVNI